ncbi:Gfo/Idh/MocA family protein [Mycobacterium seoulense]|uniref:Gfo/Idh/MocA family protein n=1 Tax=Mycobacterium seoulense TaxID=386911 RepID=UPI003CF799E7
MELIDESKSLGVILRQRPAGVVIATPSATHAKVAIPFIEAGVPTFIEKPMATTVNDALRIRDAAFGSGAPVVVGHVQLYNPAFQVAKNVLPDLGPVHAVLWEGMNHHPRNDSSVLWDWLPHGLSMAQALLGATPASAQAWGVGDPPGFKAAIARFVISDVPVVTNVSWMSPLKRHRMTILGEGNSLTFDDTAKRKVSLSVSGSTSFPSYGDEPPLTRELRAFIDVLGAGKWDMTGLGSEVAIVRAIAAAEQSARSAGRLVAIDICQS